MNRSFVLCNTINQTRCLAAGFARGRFVGCRILLRGSVGSGKSEFSRAFVREVYGDPDMVVPSPTYLLQNIYDDVDGPEIHHYDLYRLIEGELNILDIDDSFCRAVSLVEWPERLGSKLRPDFHRIELQLFFPDEAPVKIPEKEFLSGDTSRLVEISGIGRQHRDLAEEALKEFNEANKLFKSSKID